MEVEMLINDIVAKFAEYGYVVKAEYTFLPNGEVKSITLVFCGRLA